MDLTQCEKKPKAIHEMRFVFIRSTFKSINVYIKKFVKTTTYCVIRDIRKCCLDQTAHEYAWSISIVICVCVGVGWELILLKMARV